MLSPSFQEINMISSIMVELTIISNVFTEVEAMSLTIDKNFSGKTYFLADLETTWKYESKMLEEMLHKDSLLEKAIHDQEKDVSQCGCAASRFLS